ncbi:MAG: DUF2461 domain-containing protein [Chlorobium sp.]|nr:MAG: DUF2461 domain-containing protein [Chlorobium sp.]
MITNATLSFLRHLKANNDRSWFGEHKSEYQQAYSDMLETVVHLLVALSEFDNDIASSPLDPKSCIMRINRDIRFSKEKSPYKTNFFAFINKGGRKSPWGGYYLHLEPGGSFAGGGIYMPEPAVLEQTRRAIDAHFDEWQGILAEKVFTSQFPDGVLPSGKLVRPPKGYESDNPAVEYLKFKGYYTQRFFSDDEVCDPEFTTQLANTFRAVSPVVHFLNRALLVD